MTGSYNKREASDVQANLGTRQVLDNSITLYVSHQGGEPSTEPVLMTATHDDYVCSLVRQALCSGSALDVAHFIKNNPYKAQRLGLSSVYVDRAGTVHLLNPHGHTIAAYTAIRDNLPAGYEANSKTLPNSKIDFRNLTRLSGGIMRGQFYPDGIGMSVDLTHPPTLAQLRAMEDYHALTFQQTFVAELYDGETLLGYGRSMASLRCVLEKARGIRGEELKSAVAECSDVVIRANLPESIGGRIGG